MGLLFESGKIYNFSKRRKIIMECINCKKGPIASVVAKCKDMCMWECEEQKIEGYVTRDEIGDNDYIKFKYCLNCGTIQDEFPVKKIYVNQYYDENGIII
jgi:hypothetical protein